MKFPKLVAKMESSSIKEVYVVRVQEGKREAFYTLRPTPQPLLCNQGHLMEKSQFKDCNPTTSPSILPWDLS
jgi:hypothetical protein